MFTPLGLDHVVLRVRNQAVSERFYRDVLGCTLERVDAAITLVQLRFGEHLIDLLPALPGAAAPDGREMDHLCLSIRCEDVAAVARELARQGVALEGDVATRYGAYGEGPSLYLRDPDGHRIELKPR
jgi:glyoxylase I family protein